MHVSVLQKHVITKPQLIIIEEGNIIIKEKGSKQSQELRAVREAKENCYAGVECD